MLILTRGTGISIVTGQNIKVTVFGVRESRVRIAVAAPRNIPMHREEIFIRIAHEEKATARL